MARVEADAETLVAVERVEDRCQLVERAPDRSTGARGVLHQQPRSLAAPVEHLRQRRHGATEPDVEAGTEVRTDVEDHRLRVDRARGVDRCPHRGDAFLVDRVVGRSKVDEVERVDDRGEAGFLAPLAKTREVVGVMVGKAPRPRALHEQLDTVGPHRNRVVERLLDAARAMSAEEHATNLPGCPSVSAWRRAPRASYTSGTSARRSSTGCSHVTRTASSASGSKTPTRAAKSQRQRNRSNAHSRGSVSTGTAR